MRQTFGKISRFAAVVVEHHRVPAAKGGNAHPDVDSDIEPEPDRQVRYLAWLGGSCAKCRPRSTPAAETEQLAAGHPAGDRRTR